MVQAIIIGLSIMWSIYKFIATKQIQFLVLACFTAILQLCFWPFFLNKNLVLGVLAFSNALWMALEVIIRKKIASVTTYIISFVLLGILLLGNAFFPDHLLSYQPYSSN